MEKGMIKQGNVTPERMEDRLTQPPRVDIFENNNEFLFLIDMPGVEQTRVRVQLDKEELTIHGDRSVAPVGRCLDRELGGYDYQRTFLIPPGTDGNRISAKLVNGVLSLTLPKTEAVRTRQIDVKAG
ncbi:MAG: Hsp20/alpha crystallin family protein [Deltaproteobacteria bacterium]|nr:Hsp20/alpha crystallin family protein [Deltaproteobacteria bacterium]